ncbi:MAG: histidine kinase [Desulfobacterales bacterium CG07_land_8_20_14_0_80_52_14]|nr:MAG: histidine kinase [Desulfobacterales bacterium CG23_combo_of_CG06-09_8_20_14_all_52_9]PIU49826.1 MAG: histidine kinase [Desulfobacterales bacterium CG07_land_8_20_14_0_80_52_14]
MSVITISRASYSLGKEIAEKLAQRLGYTCIAREILLEASKEFNIPEAKLFRALSTQSSFLDRISSKKHRYIAYIQSSVLHALNCDNVVYHGFAGHFFVKDIPHVFKVRIIADPDERAKLVMARDGVSKDDALHFLTKLDEQRTKWSQFFYGINTSDPSLYDLVIHIKRISVDDAVEIISNSVRLERFQTTPDSKEQMNDLCLAAAVRASLLDIDEDVEVVAQKGEVTVRTRSPQFVQKGLAQHIKDIVKKATCANDVRVETFPTSPLGIWTVVEADKKLN